MGVDAFWSGSAARLFALCTTVLAVKLLLLAAYAALVARRNAVGGLAEGGADGGGGEAPAPDRTPLPRRIAAARRDDLEHLALFFIVGLLFLRLGQAGAPLPELLFVPFAVASFFHSWCVLAELPRWRAVNGSICWVCLLLMAAFVVAALLRAG